MKRTLPRRTGDPACFIGRPSRMKAGPMPPPVQVSGQGFVPGPAAHNSRMSKRLASLLVVLAAAVLALLPRLQRDPLAWEAGKRSGPLYFVGSGNSLELVRGGDPFAKKTGRAKKALEGGLERYGERPELRDALSPASEDSQASAASWSLARAGDLRSARRGPGGAAIVGAPAGKAFGTRIERAGREARPTRLGGLSMGTRGSEPAAQLKSKPTREARTAGASAAGGTPLPPPHAARDFDSRRVSPGGARLAMGSSAAVPSWSPKEREKPKKPLEKPKAPLTLSDWIGKGPLKAPTGKPKPPTFSPLKALFPNLLPDGRAYERATPPPAVLELVTPPEERPDYEAWLEKDEHRGRKAEAHWHQDGKTWLLHAGKAWGIAEGGGWSWMLSAERRWWTVADGAQRMLRHDGAWWWRTKDGWFLLKGGEPWAWRHFPEWQGQGVIHPTRGTQVVYSADGGRVAILTPGQETVVFDALSGEVLARFPAKSESLQEDYHGKPE